MFRTFCGLIGFLKRRNSSGSPKESRNIVILGPLGIGKSSLVNMLIGRPVAPVSSDIGVVHPPIVEYPVPFSEISGDSSSPLHAPDSHLILRLYDTLGLEHHPSPWGAIKAHLKRSGGVDVVVYCMRRGRLSKEQIAHLDVIWKTLCQVGDAPLVLVVNDMDYQHGSTEQWWEANGEDLKKAVRVKFADYICLNTRDPDHPSWAHQGTGYNETQKLVRDLVIRHCKYRRPAE